MVPGAGAALDRHADPSVWYALELICTARIQPQVASSGLMLMLTTMSHET
jgi:hypothetical protein